MDKETSKASIFIGTTSGADSSSKNAPVTERSQTSQGEQGGIRTQIGESRGEDFIVEVVDLNIRVTIYSGMEAGSAASRVDPHPHAGSRIRRSGDRRS